MDFRGFRSLHLRHLRKWGQHYYTVLFSPSSTFHWPQNTWPWMTLNGMNGHFTLNFHYYELPLSNYLLLIYCRVSLYMWPAKTSGKRSSRPWFTEYLESVKKTVDLKTLHRRNLNKRSQHFYIVLLSAVSPFHSLQHTWLWMTLDRHFA